MVRVLSKPFVNFSDALVETVELGQNVHVVVDYGRDMAEKFRTELETCTISRFNNQITIISNGVVNENYGHLVAIQNSTSNRQAEFDWTVFAPARFSDDQVKFSETLSQRSLMYRMH